MNAKDRLIVALDHDNIVDADRLTQLLGDRVGFYKVGLGSLAIGGGALALNLRELGKKIFMDLKFFDIPATVERAVRGQIGLGVNFLTVHGDPSVVAGAVAGRGDSDVKILAVTILTSSDRSDLDAALIKDGSVADLVVERASRAFEAGADGVIASAEEAKLIRALPHAKGKIIVTPGIRPEGVPTDDQKRIITPGEAVKNGSDFLVVGRPIIRAPNPIRVVDAIIEEIDRHAHMN